MEHVVYLLGAGFSAPLGLPVVRDFLFKAKDQFTHDPEKYASFQLVFQAIDEMARAKNYVRLDLFDIEEILSVLEMQDHVGENSYRTAFHQFVKDVITYYTPALNPPSEPFHPRKHSAGDFFLVSSQWRPYINYVASLLGLRLDQTHGQEKELVLYDMLAWSQPEERDQRYSIITLNYDRVIEKVLEFIGANFASSFDDQQQPRLSLAKLHGSVDAEIVPPTWSKLTPEEVRAAWKEAWKLIREANQIRILGYSLPVSDVYIKYLLTTGLKAAENLRQIDVICLDPDGEVRKRFGELITFPRYRFKDKDIRRYLQLCSPKLFQPKPFRTTFDQMEPAHLDFMGETD